MRNILVSLLMLSGLCASAKDKKEKPAPAFKKGDVTAIVGYGIPTSLWQKPMDSYYRSNGAYITGAEWHLSRAFKVGGFYSYYHLNTGMLTERNRYSGALYQREKSVKGHCFMVNGDYCYLNRGRVSLAAGLGLGVAANKSTSRTFDSTGTSRTGSMRRYYSGELQLRLLNARVKLTNNFGVLGALGMGPGGRVVVGAHYTFTGRKKVTK